MRESDFLGLERRTRLIYVPLEKQGTLAVLELDEDPRRVEDPKGGVKATWVTGIPSSQTAVRPEKCAQGSWVLKQDPRIGTEDVHRLTKSAPPKTGSPPAIQVLARNVRRLHPPEYWLAYAPRTQQDLRAILVPDAFIAIDCGYDWKEAKGFYEQYRKNPQAGLSHPHGGMQALLDYRWWVTEQILRAVRRLAAVRVLRAKGRIQRKDLQLEWLPVRHVNLWKTAAKKLGWDMPGSTDPTSDIDLNTYGDGTEWAVRGFNRTFASLYDWRESGTVFDVNLYAQDFKPDVRVIKTSAAHAPQGRGAGAKTAPIGAPLAGRVYQEPTRGHRFASERQREEDAKNQERVSLLHLRRRVPEKLWSAHKEALALSGEIEKEYQENQEQLAAAIENLKKVRIGLPGGAAEMAAENHLYEIRLEEVERQKIRFDLVAFAVEQSSAAGGDLSAEERKRHLADAKKKADSEYVELKRLRSKAVYFANESYATAGSLTQVVAGKQELSRGTGHKKHEKARYDNIAYTADELLHSLNEQVAFIFHTARKDKDDKAFTDFLAKGWDDESFGKFLLKAGKYLHRLFNALKHLYLIFYYVHHVHDLRERRQAPTPAPAPADNVPVRAAPSLAEGLQPRDPPPPWARGWPHCLQKDRQEWPHCLQKDRQEWEKIRRACGYGLEALKRLDPTEDYSDDFWKDLKKRLSSARRSTLETQQLIRDDRARVATDLIREHFTKLDLGLDPKAGGATVELFLKALLTLAAKVTADHRELQKIPVTRETHCFEYWIEGPDGKPVKSSDPYPYPVPEGP